MKYLVLANGCHECGCPTMPLKWFKTEKEAEEYAENLPDFWEYFGGHGGYDIWKVGETESMSEYCSLG